MIKEFQEIYKSNNFLLHSHTYGDCIFSEELKLVYVPIPKNGSSSTRDFLLTNNWKIGNFTGIDFKNYLFFCPLRDPCERWISGAKEFVTRNFNVEINHDLSLNEDICKLLVNIKNVDEHTMPQVLFLPIDCNIEFIRFDKNYNCNLLNYLASRGMNKIDTGSVANFLFNRPTKTGNSLLTKINDLINSTLLQQKLTEEYDFHNGCNFIF